jgi:hypothetical protein
MNFKNYIALAVLLPIAVRAEFAAQKDGISVMVTTPVAGEQVLQAYNMPLKTEQFTAQNYKPVWVEITNTTDRSLELSNRSISIAQIDKQVIAKKYKYRAVLWPFLGWFGIWSMCNTVSLSDKGYALYLGGREAMLAHERMAAYNKGIGQEIAKVAINIDGWGNMSQTEQRNLFDNDARFADLRARKATVEHDITGEGLVEKTKPVLDAFILKYNWLWRLNRTIRWANWGVAISLWWVLSSFNKELEVVLNQQLLQDPIIVAPGQTIKKLVVLDNTTAINRFALSIFDARTHMVKSQFEVII